ncbi:PAS domain S-box protein [Labilibacter sediminis]|nr:PAS domain S-box protein [Labilibacter sediminis]
MELLLDYKKNKWQKIVDLIAKIIMVPAALIMYTDNEYMEVLVTSRSKNNPYHVGDKEKWHGLYCETVIKSQKELLIPNALKDKAWDKNPDIKLGMISYLGYPINYPDNKHFGTICVLDLKENNYSDKHRELLVQFRDVIENDLMFMHGFRTQKEKLNQQIIQQNIKLKQTNIELINTKEKVEESEAKFRELFNCVDDAIFIYNPDTYEIIEANNATAKLYGYSNEELIGMSCLKFSAEVEKSKAAAESVKRNGKVLVNLRHHKKKDGSDIFVELSAYNIQVNEKNIFFSVCHDITDIRKIQSELIQAKEKAEESDRLKSAFLANMSHEIRTPMNGILGFTSLLKEPGLSGEQQQQYISIIEKSGDRMLNTIHNIIDVSKIESDQVLLTSSNINIHQVINELFEFFLPQAMKKNILLSITTRPSLHDIIIKSDKEKLTSILSNLIKNAIKYTNEGSIELGYSKNKEAKEKNELLFYIKDTGIGVPMDRQKTIFDRFIQAQRNDKQVYEGSGLGLAISKAYVEMLGGQIWVESKNGVGSQFYFTLPYGENTKV